MKIAGIDLAWKSERNSTAASFGVLNGHVIHLTEVHPALASVDEVKKALDADTSIQGVAIDAPLVIQNISGQRECEKQLSRDYAARYASCHASNLSLYPNPASVSLSNHLRDCGFGHLQRKTQGKWQIECYPHPAIIEIFGLSQRLAYKKGNVVEKKQGQVNLANHITSLEMSAVLSLHIPFELSLYVEEERIRSLAGGALKENEDVLDSIICLYICALFASEVMHKVYGSVDKGYIYVPRQKCI